MPAISSCGTSRPCRPAQRLPELHPPSCRAWPRSSPPAARRRPRRAGRRLGARLHRTRVRHRRAGPVAFTGTDAVLLASANSSATSYSVTLTSLDGGTLGIAGLAGLFGATSGPTLSFGGSLSLVNTVLAHLTDTVPSGTDVVHIVATDSSGNTAVRDVGVQTATPVGLPPSRPGCWPPTSSSASPTAPRACRPGAGGTLDVAGELGNSGILVVGGVQSELSLAGDLDARRQHLVARGAVAQRLQHREPHDRRHLVVEPAAARTSRERSAPTRSTTPAARSGATARSTPRAAAHHQQRHDRGGGRLHAGLQRLTVADNLTGTGTLTIDAGATLVLSGAVQDQTITFAANSVSQFANTLFAQHARAEASRGS